MVTVAFNVSLQIEIYEMLGNGKYSLEELALRVNCYPDELEKILDLLVAVHLLEFKDGIYSNTEISLRYLTGLHNSKLNDLFRYSMKSKFNTETVLNIISGRKSPDIVDHEGELESYMEAMDVGSKYAAYRLARELKPEGSKLLLDVGCGSGIYSITMCKFYKNLKAECVDHSETLKIVKRKIEESGLNNRIIARPCDISQKDFTDGRCYDYILLSNVLHFFNLQDICMILNRCFSALNVGGKVIINDIFLQKCDIETIFYSLEWLSNGVLFIDKQELCEVLLKIGYTNIKVMEIEKTPSSFVFAEKEEINEKA